MKVNAITKPIQQIAKPMSKPRKALLSAVAATALALTPMTTLNAQETGKEKVENVDSKKTNAFMTAYCALSGVVITAMLGLTIYNYRFLKNYKNENQTKENNIEQSKNC